ncbi:hypothetical protein EVAR_36349_1 [Eumeta japonica]|uniref:Uncharacterized protein n=1 Tax=Eumeta variegata TaxID=151549 RepID=A0A4C1W632_EUMVA|nr:hypothetical protein EVAR_36349_1 [Eumeta japonica]
MRIRAIVSISRRPTAFERGRTAAQALFTKQTSPIIHSRLRIVLTGLRKYRCNVRVRRLRSDQGSRHSIDSSVYVVEMCVHNAYWFRCAYTIGYFNFDRSEADKTFLYRKRDKK